ncbi:hypothetical protein, partial [Embleya sp. NPDC055610]
MIDDALIRDAESAARALLDRRIDLIRELAASTAELEPLLQAAAAGEQRALQAWSDALAGGWTLDELRRLGYRDPDKRPTPKKPTTKRTPPTTTPPPPTPTPETPPGRDPAPETPPTPDSVPDRPG